MAVEQFSNSDWSHDTPRFWRRLGRVLLRDALLLAVLVLVAETGLRVLAPSCAAYIFTDTLTSGHPRSLNSRGLRDREFPTERPADEIRLLCLGNSTTRGEGVAMAQAYPKQLEALLQTRDGGGCYFVINAGGQGKSLNHAVTFLEQDGLAFDVSLVVLGFSPSMLAVLANAKAPSPGARTAGAAKTDRPGAKGLLSEVRKLPKRLRAVLYGSYLHGLVDDKTRKFLYWCGVLRGRTDAQQGAMFAYAGDVPGVDIDRVAGAYDTLAARLGDIQGVLQARQIPLVVLGIPSQFEISDQACDNKRRFPLDRLRISPLDRVATYCRTRDIPFVDLRPRLRAERKAMLEGLRSWDQLYTVRMDFTHLNNLGLHLAAEELLKEIDARGWLPACD